MVLNIDPYTPKEILDYAEFKQYELSKEEQDIVSNLCVVPGEVDLLMRYNVLEFYDFVKTVIDNIGVVNGANAFKIGLKLNYKENDGGWDIGLFMRAIMFVCKDRMLEQIGRAHV